MSLISGFLKSNTSWIEVLKFIATNRMKLYGLLKHITWDDILNGSLVITEDMIESELKPLLQAEMEKNIKISSMKFWIRDGKIQICIDGKYSLFSFTAYVFIEIMGFEFYPGKHFIELGYREEISSVWGFDNEKLMKILKNLIYGFLKNSFIHKSLNGRQGILVDDKRIIIDLDSILEFSALYRNGFIGALLSTAEIGFVSSDEGRLTFKVNFRFEDNLRDIALTDNGDEV